MDGDAPQVAEATQVEEPPLSPPSPKEEQMSRDVSPGAQPDRNSVASQAAQQATPRGSNWSMTGAPRASCAPGSIPDPNDPGFVSSGAFTTGLFAGAVDAHNALLDRFTALEVQVGSIAENQQQLATGLSELSHKHAQTTGELQDRLSAHDAKFSEVHTQITAGQEAHQALVEVQKNADAEQDRKLRTLDEKLTPEMRSLEKAVEDLVSKQSEMVSRTLPQWRSELSSEIQKLATDLSRLQDATTTRDRELEEKITATNTAWRQVCQELDGRLTAEDSSLKNLITNNENQLTSLKDALKQTSARLGDADKVLSENLAVQDKLLRAFVKEEVATAHTTLRTEVQARMTDVENALKQETFERLRNTEVRAREIEALNASLQTSRGETTQRFEALASSHGSELNRLRTEVEAKATLGQMAKMADRMKSTEELGSSLQNGLACSGERLESTATALKTALQDQAKAIERKSKETNNAVAAVKVEEGVKMADLEAQVQQSQSERNQLAESLGREVLALRAALEGSLKASTAHADEAAAAVERRLEPVKQAVTGLSRDLDELGRLQEQCEGGLTKLEGQVSSVQQKAAPIDDAQRRLLEMEWYLSAERTSPFATAGAGCLSCGRRAPPERAMSPSASQNAGATSLRGGGMGDSVGWSWRGPVPQPPNSARPSSASHHRRTGEAHDMHSTPPAGHALSAARHGRKPIPSSVGADRIPAASDPASATPMSPGAQYPQGPAQYYRSGR